MPGIVADAPGAQATPKQPLVKPAMNTSSARADPCVKVNTVNKATSRPRPFAVAFKILIVVLPRENGTWLKAGHTIGVASAAAAGWPGGYSLRSLGASERREENSG